MNIQEAIRSGKPFRRKSWFADTVFVVFNEDDIVLALETDHLTSIELDVQDVLAEDWYTREDEPIQGALLYAHREFAR